MPKPDKSSPGAFERLDHELDAFEASRRPKPFAAGIGGETGGGYRLLGQMLGGVLGGVGLGWLVDRLAHTGPWGILGGLVIGSGLSIWATVRTASAMSAKAQSGVAPAPSAPSDDEDDD